MPRSTNGLWNETSCPPPLYPTLQHCNVHTVELVVGAARCDYHLYVSATITTGGSLDTAAAESQHTRRSSARSRATLSRSRIGTSSGTTLRRWSRAGECAGWERLLGGRARLGRRFAVGYARSVSFAWGVGCRGGSLDDASAGAAVIGTATFRRLPATSPSAAQNAAAEDFSPPSMRTFNNSTEPPCTATTILSAADRGDLAGLAGDVGEAAGDMFAGLEDAHLAAVNGRPGAGGGNATADQVVDASTEPCQLISVSASRHQPS